jgi:Cu(I)/Ag(I) efflux system membrane fusion protein
MKTPAVILLTLALAVPATWLATRHSHVPAAGASAAGDRQVLFYQSAMHPWVKSDKPGRCTICGMALTPVFEGEKGMEAAADVVSLNQSMVQVLNVQTAEAQQRPLTKTLTFAGMVDDDARRHRIISAYVDGRIEKLYINHHGAAVTEGKPLVEIYSPALLQAEREYRSTSGELRHNVALRLRQMGLTSEQIAALPQKSPDALTTEILAPISGTTVNDDIYAGQYVTTGQKLFELADFSTMWFVFRAYEQDISWLKVGQVAEVTTPSVPGRVFTGTIAFIDPNFDPVTRATQVRVELPNPLEDGRRPLLHRLYGDAAVKLDAPEVLTVPRSAVIQTGPEAVVYVAHEDGNYARQAVKLGRRGDALVEILTGVEAGDKVVTNGNLLIDGQAEMNRSFSAQPAMPMTAGPALTHAQHKAVEAFTKIADSIAAALAKDDLAAFNQVGPDAMPATEALATSLADRADVADPLKKLSDARHLHGAADLETARKMFLAFSTAAVAVLEPLRKGDKPAIVEVFECPMVDKAVPGTPKKGRWLQLAGTSIRNPYFGGEMLDCGVKVKP